MLDNERPHVKMLMWGETLTIIGRSSDNGISHTRLFPRIEGKHMRTCVVPDLVLDMLATVSGNMIVKFKDKESVMLFQPEQDPKYQYLCMPHGDK